jgi:hypothetical protein
MRSPADDFGVEVDLVMGSLQRLHQLNEQVTHRSEQWMKDLAERIAALSPEKRALVEVLGLQKSKAALSTPQESMRRQQGEQQATRSPYSSHSSACGSSTSSSRAAPPIIFCSDSPQGTAGCGGAA